MINGKRAVAICGVESTGKSTMAMMLAGRLRTEGVLAEVSQAPGRNLPFAPQLFDKGELAWVYSVTNKIAGEAALATKANIEFIVCDRSPMDFVAYYDARFGTMAPFAAQLHALAAEWVAQYDQIYYLPASGTIYREDGFRAKASENDWRDKTDARLRRLLEPFEPRVVEGSYRKRCEYVYHHVLYTFFGRTRPLHAYEQIRRWFSDRGYRIVEVKPQGSNSITRFHPASDQDDIDAMVIVDGGVEYAKEVRAAFWEDKEHMENVVQANLDILVTPKGMEAHEV